ncbi:O-antigen ligase family protein [Roseateles asaccharophilus]|uniref:O-antigen ligase family protein n=1 Tax=Roseateles asaccharophilus TaxID=582607 RepID=UPI00391CE5CF
MATWNAVLRPSANIPITPYYLLMPFVGALMVSRSAWASRWFLWLALFGVYGLVVGTCYGVPVSMQAAQLLKYAQLTTFLGLLVWLGRIDPGSRHRLQRIVLALTATAFVIASIQQLTGLEFPTVVNEESSLWLNTFFFTPNDLALFLCGAFCLVLCSDNALWKKTLFFLAFIALNLRNDAKAAILASLLMIGMFALLLACRSLNIRPLIGLLTLVVLMPLSVVAMNDTIVKIGETEFDFIQLFQDPLNRLANLEPYDLGGSIFDRTDALIHSIEALKSNHWLGLGPAGSVHTLSLPNFELLTAKSLHNAIAEVLIEFGPAALMLAFILLRPYAQALLSKRPTPHQMGLMCFVAAAPLLSVSQSSGYISNYAFWLTAYLIWSPWSDRKTSAPFMLPTIAPYSPIPVDSRARAIH